MTVTAHGLACDVCNEYILLEPSGNPFRIFGVDGLHAHGKCKRLILALDLTAPLFWRSLPEGRVRQLAEDIHERDCGPECRYCPPELVSDPYRLEARNEQ